MSPSVTGIGRIRVTEIEIEITSVTAEEALLASSVQKCSRGEGPFDPPPSARKRKAGRKLPPVCQVNEAAAGSFKQLNGI